MSGMYWMRRRVHTTWQFTALCLGVITGIGLAYWWASAWMVWLLVPGLILTIASMIGARRWWLVFALLAGLCLGLARGSTDRRSLAGYEVLYGKAVTLSGVISEDVDANARGGVNMQLRTLSHNSTPIYGQLWVSTTGKPSVRRSDVVEISGKLKPGFGNFAGVITNAKILNVSRPMPGDVALNVRDGFAEKIRSAIHEPAASLGVGYLLGQKRALPNDLADALVVTGLTHIVVASGYNLTILVRLARKAFEKHSKYLVALTSITLMVGFIAMTGLSPSMTRAGLVAGLSLWAWYVGRKFHPVTLLLFAMSVTVLWNPSYLWGNLGWALSFAAFAGVMVLAPLMHAYFWGSEKPSAIGRILMESFAAQVVTMPIILVAFGKLSVISLLANMLIVPFVPLAMLMTLAAGIVGWLMPPLAHVAGLPAEWVLDAMIWVIKCCAEVPWAQISLAAPVWVMAVWYGALVSAAGFLWWRTKLRLRDVSLVE